MSDFRKDLPAGRQEKLQTARGIVTEALPSTLFRVRVNDEEKEILAYLGGKMRMHRIKVLIGDSVEMVLDPYGGKGRIIKRL
ncbi:MAG: translation initiation factor IF-1 [Candidatus Pacebacteria bacterium]|nr:translation initiation factor IF-1 [Candidatus Paceibacterota bacterium]